MISERLYRVLLLAYPREHQREYGEPMVQLFRDRMRRDGGGFRALIVWVRMIFDFVRSVPRERKEEAMFESVTAKKAFVRSSIFLFRSFLGAIILYLITASVVLMMGIVSLATGWYAFDVASGPLGFLGYTMHVDNTTTEIAFEANLIGFFVLVVGGGILIRVGPAVRALNSSMRSWAGRS